MCLYYGNRRCGKTSILNILNHMGTDNSVYRTSKKYKERANGGGPSPNTLHMKSKYISIINEVEEIGTVLLKTMTGDDSTNDDRTIYSTKFPMINSCTFLVAACNKLPYMHMPDEAVRDRLVIFPFRMRAVDNIHTKEPNCLLAFTEQHTHKQQIDEKEASMYLSHMLYVYHRKFRNENGIISARTTNEVSLKLLDQFMVANNWVYAVMNLCNIKRSPTLSMRLTDLQDAIIDAIEKYNKDYNKTFSYSNFQSEFKVLFKLFYKPQMSMYVGIGVPQSELTLANTSNQLEKMLTIIKDPSATTRLKLLKGKLRKICPSQIRR